MKPLVIYHDNCADGFGAAFAAWLKLGDEAEYIPMQYNKVEYPAQLVNYFSVNEGALEERDVYILDFSLPREVMDYLFTRCKRVVWLDHHKTAFEMWCGKYEKGSLFEHEETYQDYGNDVKIVLDDNKSGAMLAWEYFHPVGKWHEGIPRLIKHIDDRDRWQFKVERTKEFSAALWSHRPWSFEQWKYLFHGAGTSLGLFYAEGAAILRAEQAQVKATCEGARKCMISFDDAEPGDIAFREVLYPGLAVNTNLNISEVGSELANKCGAYGLVWYVGGDGRVRCSLRSNGDYDVSSIARSFGGGGHRNAAGFETDIQTLMGWLGRA